MNDETHVEEETYAGLATRDTFGPLHEFRMNTYGSCFDCHTQRGCIRILFSGVHGCIFRLGHQHYVSVQTASIHSWLLPQSVKRMS